MTCSDCKLKNVCLERSRDYCCRSFKRRRRRNAVRNMQEQGMVPRQDYDPMHKLQKGPGQG